MKWNIRGERPRLSFLTAVIFLTALFGLRGQGGIPDPPEFFGYQTGSGLRQRGNMPIGRAGETPDPVCG